MKQIALSGEKGNGLFAMVDDSDYEELNKYRWHLSTGYATRSVRVNEKVTKVRMHREILKTPTGLETDHINRNTLDNRRENLRICSVKQNQHNRGKNKNNTSGFKGVCLEKKLLRKKWRARIVVNRKEKSLGYFSTPEEAHKAYTEAAIKYFGEFAWTS